MINRILIRIKVLQAVYAYYLTKSKDLVQAEKDFNKSLKKSHDLYYYLLELLVEITHLHQEILEQRKNKYLPTGEELNPNTSFADNLFIKLLEENESFKSHINNELISWNEDNEFLRQILELIEQSEQFKDYMEETAAENYTPSLDRDRELWRALFKQVIIKDEDFENYLQDKCIYWNDDIPIISTFVIKTIKQLKEDKNTSSPLIPMFKDEEDQEFANDLLRKTILNGSEYRKIIENQLSNWDSERLALIDMVIMQIALAEILNFDNIPLNVTMNEYIDLAKYYSTPKSGVFINGILDAIAKSLKKENKILKE